MKEEETVRYKTLYKIYEISQDGLLKEPRREGYERSIIVFDEYTTEQDAFDAIEKEQEYGNFIILKIIEVDYSNPHTGGR